MNPALKPPATEKKEKAKEKKRKTAEDVNNSCRQYDFFM